MLYDEITTIDSALTRPWTVTKKYARLPNRQPEWIEEVCAEGNSDIEIGGQSLFPQRRRLPDADQKGSAAAGPAAFQAVRIVRESRPHADC